MIPTIVLTGFIKTVLPNIRVVKQNQEAGSPEMPYCAWSRLASASSGRPIVNHGSTSGGVYLENIDIVKDQTLEIQFYTKTEEQAFIDGESGFKPAEELADEFIARLQSTNSKIYQAENDIGVLRWNNLTTFVKFMGDINEERSVVEVIINYVDNYQEQSGSVDLDSIVINTTLEDL
jgi:hypothetical protein